MTQKWTTLAPNGRFLFVQGSVRIDDSLYVDDNANVGIDLFVGRDATIGRDLLVRNNARIDQNLDVGVDAVVGNNANVLGTTFSSRLEVADESILDTRTEINGQLFVTGDSLIIGTTDIIGDTTITANPGQLTTIDGDLLVTGNGTQIIGQVTDPVDSIVTNFLRVNDTTFLNGNLFVNGVFVQTIGNSANLIENIFSNVMESEFLITNQSTTLNRNVTVQGNGFQQFGFDTSAGANANVELRIDEYFGNNMDVINLTVDVNIVEELIANNITANNLVVNETTELNGDTNINGNLLVNGVDVQTIGTANNRIEDTFIDNADINDLTVNTTTSLNGTTTMNDDTTINGDLSVTGEGTQVFGQNLPGRTIEQYWGADMDLTGDLNLEGDLFMLDENKKDFLDLATEYVVYVKKNGDDNRTGQNLDNAVQTIRRGLELAKKFREDNPVTGYEPDTTTFMVSVYPGVYVEEGDLEIPENTAVVAAGGQYVTEVHMSDVGRRNFRNMFLLNSGSYAQGFSFRNMEVDSFEDPTGGFAYAFAPGARIIRSPYVRDSSQLSNYDPSALAAPLDPANGNPLVGRGAGMILADRRILSPDSIFPYILAFGATPRSPNGIGYCARDGAGINGISSLGIFQRICFYALNGGQVTLNNSGTQFGDISMQATGFVTVVEENNIPEANLTLDPIAAANITAQANALVDAMWANLVIDSTANVVVGPDGTNATAWTSEFQYAGATCARDVGLIVDSIEYDVATGSNYNSVLAGIAYRRQASSKVTGNQLMPTLNGLSYIRDYIVGDTSSLDDLAQDEDNDALPGTISGLIDPALPESGIGISDINKKLVVESVDIIQDALRINEFAELRFPPTLNTSNVEIAAKDLLQLNKEIIQSDIVGFVDVNFPTLNYDANLCFRDVGFMIDALSHDILYDSNRGSVVSADSYFSGVTAQLPSSDETNATISAFTELQSVVSDVLVGTYPGQLQLPDASVADTDEANTAVDLIQITIDVLQAGNTDSLPAVIPPTPRANVVGDITLIGAERAALQGSTVAFIDATTATYYEDITKRDARNLLTALSFDLTGGTQMVTQSFTLGLFNGIDAQLVYPQEQTPAFVYCWEFLRDALEPVVGNVTPAYSTVTRLIDDVLIETVTNPTRIEFSSLIESLGHQFNNAGAGVNRNALPLNFRQPGFNRPVPFSVLQTEGGRVRWSGADELNNQYFAGGTRINGQTGKFEGRPFNISVRQIARRIANSRGFF